MMSPTPRGTTAVPVNGPALSVIRQLQNVDRAAIAEALECSVSYLSRLESGSSRRCSPSFLTGLCRAVGSVDRRALLAADPAALVDGRGRRGDVHLNGVALGTVRRLSGAGDRRVFARVLDVTFDELVLLEARAAAAVSPALVARAAVALGIADRCALLADPYGEHDAVTRWSDNVEVDTAPMVRPVGDPAGVPVAVASGRHRRPVAS